MTWWLVLRNDRETAMLVFCFLPIFRNVFNFIFFVNATMLTWFRYIMVVCSDQVNRLLFTELLIHSRTFYCPAAASISGVELIKFWFDSMCATQDLTPSGLNNSFWFLFIISFKSYVTMLLWLSLHRIRLMRAHRLLGVNQLYMLSTMKGTYETIKLQDKQAERQNWRTNT